MSDHPYLTSECYENVKSVLDSGLMSGYRGSSAGNLGGPMVQRLEEAFCSYFNVKYAIATSSATAALHTALLACGLENQFIMTTPTTFSASASCVRMAGGVPIFCDIDEDTFNMDITKRMTHKDSMVAVHLMGHPLDMDGIMKVAEANGLAVIEDASQALGATYKGRKVGTIGDCGVFSFNQSKSITSGEGGMLITNSDEIAYKARLIRNHGETQDEILGYNYRLTELQAAVLLPQFAMLDMKNGYRVELADYLTSKLSQIEGITPPVVREGCVHTYYTYGVKVDATKIGMHRNEFQSRVNDTGLYWGNPDYGKPLYMLPGYKYLRIKEGACPVAERLWKEEFLVTDRIRWPYTHDDADEIVETFKDVIHNGS